MRALALLAIGALLVAWLLTATAPGGTLHAQTKFAGANPAFADRIGLGRAASPRHEPAGAGPLAAAPPRPTPRAAPTEPAALPWSVPAEFAPSDPLR